MPLQLETLKHDLSNLANPSKALQLQRFFKTGKGEYAEGDKFLGITVPQQRIIAKKYSSLKLNDIQQLLNSGIHEHRLVALLILIQQFKKASEEEKEQIISLYLNNTKNINNWDLVDLSAPRILGQYIFDNPNKKQIIYKLANSNHLWEKRIAMLSTCMLIKNKQFQDTIALAEILLTEKHDLLHKAVGWMLREVGKKDLQELIQFLNKHHKLMPRTMLRYAIEKLPEEKRKAYLNNKP